ncbi:WYL domain-containing protein [Bacillus aquiflavi]|uniref:WYL domain-containing protein n=1 Tax=Bacillus aquiflavi TaxID=2672567 RepID=A0A6B3W0H0_9BACI|nr:WYL domain-containing protein [Bacillus aquiflavi]MBA4537829.1 WYL domain-containing protein [Bacillus aquiflavi]NEY82085.1 WYL domain-containing protein [Bacillus aquiflavi]UAC48350.1 WYL domain-containing protein [Bacillus aquiflavi]
MTNPVSRTINRRDRLFELLTTLLESTSEVSLVKLAKTHQVSIDTIRRDLMMLDNLICKERQYFEIHWGKVYVYFQENIAPIKEDLQMYLILALKQMEYFANDKSGDAVYKKLIRFTEKSMNELDQERFHNYMAHIHISNYAYPINRNSFYEQVTLVLKAISKGNFISVNKGVYTRYLDPFGIYFAKGAFYLLAEEYELISNGNRRIPAKKKELRHFRFDRLSKWKEQEYESPINSSKKSALSKKYLHAMWEAEGPQKEPFTLELAVFDKKVWNRIKERQWTEKQTFIDNEGAEVGRLFFDSITSEQEITKWILGWGSAVQVIKPIWLKEAIQKEIKNMLKRY